MKKCTKCQTPMFTGWVENPIYLDDKEGMVDMNISYCPTCKTVENSEVSVDIYE